MRGADHHRSRDQCTDDLSSHLIRGVGEQLGANLPSTSVTTIAMVIFPLRTICSAWSRVIAESVGSP